MKPSQWTRVCRNIRGNVAVLFAVLLFPILIFVAFTVDTSRQISTGRHLQVAVDVAAMAGVRAIQEGDLSTTEIESRMADAFSANESFSNWGVTCGDPVAEFDSEDEFAASFVMSCQFPALIGSSVFQNEVISVTRAAHSTISQPSLDIALMLDLSGSMDDGARLPALKTAA
ncbi:MAG: Tad domain-containing protein, partial [Pseudomonadota bacterium]